MRRARANLVADLYSWDGSSSSAEASQALNAFPRVGFYRKKLSNSCITVKSKSLLHEGLQVHLGRKLSSVDLFSDDVFSLREERRERVGTRLPLHIFAEWEGSLLAIRKSRAIKTNRPHSADLEIHRKLVWRVSKHVLPRGIRLHHERRAAEFCLSVTAVPQQSRHSVQTFPSPFPYSPPVYVYYTRMLHLPFQSSLMCSPGQAYPNSNSLLSTYLHRYI